MIDRFRVEPGPVDRPKLSKDFLAGKAPEEWIPLRSREYYESSGRWTEYGENVFRLHDRKGADYMLGKI